MAKDAIFAILKNINKYNDIKLAKGLYLKGVKTTERKGRKGISTNLFGSSWFILPQGRAIYKTYEKANPHIDSIRNLRVVNELLCCELANILNVPCAEYKLAHTRKTEGLISFDVAKNGEKIWTVNDFYYNSNVSVYEESMLNFSKAIDSLIKKGYNIDKKEMLKTYYKYALFDCLTIQADRSKNNLLFLEDKKSKTIKLAPLIDNEFAFNIFSLPDIFNSNLKISTKKFTNSLELIFKILPIKPYDASKNCFYSNLKSIVELAKQNEEYGNIFKYMLSNFDIKTAINNVENNGVEISPEYKKYLSFTENIIKDNFKKVLRKRVKRDEYYDSLEK